MEGINWYEELNVCSEDLDDYHYNWFEVHTSEGKKIASYWKGKVQYSDWEYSADELMRKNPHRWLELFTGNKFKRKDVKDPKMIRSLDHAIKKLDDKYKEAYDFSTSIGIVFARKVEGEWTFFQLVKIK